MKRCINFIIIVLLMLSMAGSLIGCRQQNNGTADNAPITTRSDSVTPLNETTSDQTVSKRIVLPEAFPIAMTFKSFNRHTPADLAERIKDHAPYPIIHQPMDSCFDEVRKAYPEKIITKQDAYGGTVSLKLAEIWPGHLLYKPGIKLKSDCTPKDTVLFVDNYRTLATSQAVIDRTNKRRTPFYLVLYALNENGRPDWNNAERIILTQD